MVQTRFLAAINKANRVLFYLFVFFIPFNYLDFGQGPFKTGSYPIDLFLSAAGFLLSAIIIFAKRDTKLINDLLKCLAAFLAVSLISLAVVFSEHMRFHNTFITSPLSSFFQISFYLFRVLLLFLYCYVMMREVSINVLSIAFVCSLVFNAIIGLLQIGVLYGPKTFADIYGFLAKCRLFQNAEYIQTVRRIPLLANEPSWTANLIVCYFWPISFLVAHFYHKRLLTILLVLLDLILMVCALFTFSTTVYILIFFFFAMCLVTWVITKARVKSFSPLVISLFVLMTSIIAIFTIPVLKEVVVSKITFSPTNYSTARRSSRWYLALNVLLHYPAFGVGPGCIGYYEFEYLAETWFMISSETRNGLIGGMGLTKVISGGFTIITSYGLVGTAILIMPLLALRKKTLPFAQPSCRKVALIAILSFVFVLFFELDIVTNHAFPFVFFCNCISADKRRRLNYVNKRIISL